MCNFRRKHKRILFLCGTKYKETIWASHDTHFSQQSLDKIR